MEKICIFGASGFVGRALVERLIGNNDYELVAVIRSPGNAWSIIRHGIPLVQADLGDVESVKKAVQDCSIVVNLALGAVDQMAAQLQNLVNACKQQGVKRLVHLSSITVYGDLPDPSSEYESGPVRAVKGSYGWSKNKQDLIIKQANGSGLSSVVLCPPHVTGAYGRIFHQVLDGILKGEFALVDDGSYPCNLVDVCNLCQAIEKSMQLSQSDGERIFVTNGDTYTWKDLAIDASRVAGVGVADIPRISTAQVAAMQPKHLSMVVFLKSLAKQREINQMLKQTFLVQNKTILKCLQFVNRKLNNNKLKSVKAKKSGSGTLEQLNVSLCKQQLRGVWHRIDKAKNTLGYEPTVSSGESFAKFANYYETLYGYKSEYWDLIASARMVDSK